MTHWLKIKVLARLVRDAYVAHQDNGYYHTSAQKIWEDNLSHLTPKEVATLPPSLHKKMRWYMVDCRFLGELIARLLGKKVETREMDMIMLVALMGAVSDLMVDEMRVDRHEIQRILIHQNQASPTASVIEKLFFIFKKSLFQLIKPDEKDHIAHIIEIATQAQIDSSKQLDTDTNLAKIKHVAYEKGGLAAVLIGSVLTPDFTALDKPIYDVGGLIQLLNDTQDMQKDAKENITTFVRFHTTFAEVAGFLEGERQAAFKQFQNLPYEKKDVETFILSMTLLHLGILYKLFNIKKICNNQLNLPEIAKMPREKFRISPFRIQALWLFFKEIYHFRLSRVGERMNLGMFQ